MYAAIVPTLADTLLVFFCFLGSELQAHISEGCSCLLVEEREADCGYCCDSPHHCSDYHLPCYWCDPDQFTRTQTHTTIGFLSVTNTQIYATMSTHQHKSKLQEFPHNTHMPFICTFCLHTFLSHITPYNEQLS